MFNQEISDLLARVEKARREKDYVEMNLSAVKFRTKLEGEESSEAWKARARVSYEFHMADFQRFEDSLVILKKHLESSREFAERSSTEARHAGDLAGELFPQVTIGGSLLVALGQWKEGVGILKSTLEKVESAILTATTEDAPRFLRIAMNCHLFLIDIAIEHEGSASDVEGWFRKVQDNSVFQEECGKNADWGRERVQKAQEYITSRGQ
jgi:hypothetical protein